jgi:hypothetical protein
VAHKNKDMKRILNIIPLLTTLIFISCAQTDPNKQIDEGTVQNDTYTSQEIGWTIEIPKGWTVVEKEQTEANNEKGLKAMEETIEGEIDYSGLKNLIAFQKNRFNMFQSTSEPFELEYEGEWVDNNEGLKELIYTTYTNQGIKIDTSSSVTIVDDLEFEVFHITMYGPNGEIILYQDMYSRYINGFDFGVNLNYNNDKDKKVMMDVWKNSKFKKK